MQESGDGRSEIGGRITNGAGTFAEHRSTTEGTGIADEGLLYLHNYCKFLLVKKCVKLKKIVQRGGKKKVRDNEGMQL